MVVLHFGRGLKISWNPPIGIHSSIPRRGSVMEWNAKLLPDIGFGFNHMIRIVEFSDKTRWVARLRMPPLLQRGNCPHEMTRAMECEHHIIQLIRKETNMPVPQIHVFDGNLQKKVKAQFMLMVCLRGNVGMDLNMKIPSEYKASVYARMAEIHACNDDFPKYRDTGFRKSF